MTPSLQVSDLGCQAFAILFDDIDHSLCQADSEAFSSFAHAQVFVTNEVYRFLGEPPVFLFCPTGENLQESSCTVFISFTCKFTAVLTSFFLQNIVIHCVLPVFQSLHICRL